MHIAKGVSQMNHQARKGSISLLAGAMLLASATAFANVEPAAPLAGKQATVAKELQQAKTYTVSSAPTAPLELATPKLPDVSGYTAEAIAAKIVRGKAGKISVRRMMQEDALKDFIGGEPQGPGEEAAQAVFQRNLAGCVPGQIADRGRP